ncbi:mobile element transfer protein [Streptomyces sp. NPDC048362]|uniref:mobile element transfer protein n=1 Tax=Streptomyces sp. NPDC048362 TaxID=3365539 RepID=UPI0037197774
MPAHRRFRDVIRIGPVQVATSYNGRGRETHTAACTAPGCGFDADYSTRAGAGLAARTHRCKA